MSNDRKTFRERSSADNGPKKVSGYELSAGVRNLLFAVLGWSALSMFFASTGWWVFLKPFPDFLFLLKVISVVAPIVAIIFIAILYDRENG